MYIHVFCTQSVTPFNPRRRALSSLNDLSSSLRPGGGRSLTYSPSPLDVTASLPIGLGARLISPVNLFVVYLCLSRSSSSESSPSILLSFLPSFLPYSISYLYSFYCIPSTFQLCDQIILIL